MFESYVQNLATATLLSSGVLQHPSPSSMFTRRKMVSYIFILRRQLTCYKASRNYSSCYGAGGGGFG